MSKQKDQKQPKPQTDEEIVAQAKELVGRLKGRTSELRITMAVLAMFHTARWVGVQLGVSRDYVSGCISAVNKVLPGYSKLRRALQERSKRVWPAWD